MPELRGNNEEMTGRFNNSQRLDILMHLIERDGPLCQGINRDGKPCLRFLTIDEMEIDHLKPVALGGSNDLSNQNIKCQSCNDLKRSRADAYAKAAAAMCVSVSAESGDHRAKGSEIPTKAEEKPSSVEVAPVTEKASTYDNQHAQHAYVCENESKSTQERATEQKEERDLTPTMRKNRKCESPFRCWIEERLEAGVLKTRGEWQEDGAERFECSPETIDRYIGKMVSSEGRLSERQIANKVVIWFKDAYRDYQGQAGPLSWPSWYDLHRKEYDQYGNRAN